ncbi:MAG: DUF2188 domain-containing protein [Bacteroidales bacterium]|nr:DUF2188 domain-containing protein [Bacteroidales bacterium]
MPRKERHIVPNSDRGGWNSKIENAERASKHFDTTKAAIDWSREKVKQGKFRIIIAVEMNPIRQRIIINSL